MGLNEGGDEALIKLVEMTDDSEISSIKKIVTDLIAIINNPRSTVQDLKEIIEIDPPLSAKVLKTANSAYYASQRKIGDIEQAVIWIGFNELKDMALSQKVCEIFAKDELVNGYSRILLWKHSVAVAILAKMIYRRELGIRGDDIYAAGLLHDIGMIVEDQFLHDDFKNVLNKFTEEKVSLADAEFDVFGYNHADVGRALTDHWNLPREMVTAIGYHHDTFGVPRKFPVMALTLYISDYLCQMSGIGYCGFSHKIDETIFQRCLTALGLEQYAFKMIAEDLKKEISRMESRGLL